MSFGRESALEILRRREREFLLSKVKVVLLSDVQRIEAGEFRIESGSKGDVLEVPLWAGEELARSGLAELESDTFDVEIFKALSREKMMGPLQLSGLPSDFYPRMKRRIQSLRLGASAGRSNKEDLEKLRTVCYDLIGLRLSKLLSISSSSTSLSTFSDRLTPEEASFFTTSQALSKEWKSALLEEGK